MSLTPPRATLHFGDCLDVLPGIADNSIDLLLTDLPYGTTSCEWDSIIPLDRLWPELLRVTKENAALIFTSDQPFTWALCASKPKLFRYDLIWQKPNSTSPFLAKKRPMKKHESILVFYRKAPVYHPQMEKGKPYKWNSRRSGGQAGGIKQLRETPIDNTGTRYPGSVLPFKQERGLHPTQKPVSLMEWIIRSYSNEGDTVLDVAMGSGTTGVAAMKTGRNFIGIEMKEDYFRTAQSRIGGSIDPAAAL